MRLVTRFDFDGLCCAVLLQEAVGIDDYLLVHPKDMQDGVVTVGPKDVLANIPYVQGAGMWFDHHVSESARLKAENVIVTGCKGAVRQAPSAARVIWDHFGGHKTFPQRFDAMMAAVDKVDSARLTKEDITSPSSWVLLGFLTDPRTGLARHDFKTNSRELFIKLVEFCRTKSIEEIMEEPDIQERVALYLEQNALFEKMLRNHATVHARVVLLDLRNADEIYVGNRFLIYALFPQCNASVRLMWDHLKENVVFTVGHSVVNRTCQCNIGSLMLTYGGGGHPRVGTCQVYAPTAESTLEELLAILNIGEKEFTLPSIGE
jgi:nanoRNase/pAp phosphatase (c-di-AMP/oligoRNAs hydrolase)